MNVRSELKWLGGLAAVFLALYFLPVGTTRFDGALVEAFQLASWYAREHVLLCLVPAFFIAGAIGVFVSQASVMHYLGPEAPAAARLRRGRRSPAPCSPSARAPCCRSSAASTSAAPGSDRPRPSSTPARRSTRWRSS